MRKRNQAPNPPDGPKGRNVRPRLSLVPVLGVSSVSPAISTSAPLSISPPDLSDLNPAACYLAQLQPSGRPSTRARLNRVARLLGATLGTLRWHELRFEHVVAARTWLQSEGASVSTVNMTLSALRSVARAAWNLGQMSADNYQRIRDVRGIRASVLPAGRALARTEISVLLDACAADSGPAGARDACLIGLLASGLRRAECAALTLADAGVERGALRVRGKGEKERIVPLDAGVERAIQGWIVWRGSRPGALVCPVAKGGSVTVRHLAGHSIYRALARRARQAGLAHFSPHDLRRTLVSQMLDAGADIETVRDICGHTDVSTTARYKRGGERAKKRVIGMLNLPWPRPRPKRTPRCARKSRRRRRRKS
ncbi:MAG: tyrosine-type recombinase/integrase [Acidobacteria bacterium]|nr:tyrosine-type recombinase/integrase [Acidobacteriota bacterium]